MYELEFKLSLSDGLNTRSLSTNVLFNRFVVGLAIQFRF